MGRKGKGEGCETKLIGRRRKKEKEEKKREKKRQIESIFELTLEGRLSSFYRKLRNGVTFHASVDVTQIRVSSTSCPFP